MTDRHPTMRCPLCQQAVADPARVVAHFQRHSRWQILRSLWRGADTGGRVLLVVLVLVVLAPFVVAAVAAVVFLRRI